MSERDAAPQRWIQHPDAVWREIDGETVVLMPRNADFFVLNHAATLLWRRLCAPADAESLVELLQEATCGGQERELLAEHLHAWLEEAVACGIVCPGKKTTEEIDSTAPFLPVKLPDYQPPRVVERRPMAALGAVDAPTDPGCVTFGFKGASGEGLKRPLPSSLTEGEPSDPDSIYRPVPPPPRRER